MLLRERPLIAINGELVLATEAAPAKLSLAARYAEAIERAGGMPLVLPPLPGSGLLKDLLERVDGLVLSGGDDFDTDRLGLGVTHEAAKPVPAEKQDFDLELARGALAHGLPTLGICYGMQLLALAEGGDLHQHLPDDRPGCQPHAGGVEHEVRVEQGTKLASLFGVASLPVVSRHHQAVSHAGGDWVVAARDSEGLIEAIEHVGHPFAVGVQWHPELSRPGGTNDRLFAGLVDAARTAAGERLARAITS